MNKYNVTHLSSVHHLYDTRIYYRECYTLSRAGYSVTLIGVHRNNNRHNLSNIIKIIQIPTINNKFIRIFISSIRLIRKALKTRADIYHFHDPELIPIGILLKILGKRVIYDVHEDYYRDVLCKAWIPCVLRPILAKLTSFLERLGAKIFDGIVAASPSIAEKFPTNKTVFVGNFPSQHDLPIKNLPSYELRPPNVVYVGNITRVRGIHEIVEAAAMLPNDSQLILGGDFSPHSLLEEVSELRGWTRVNYKGHLKREEVAACYGSARVGLLVFKPIPSHLNALPNKLFEYMAAGLPIVASNFPCWQELINNIGCGILVNPDAPQEIAEAITWLFDHPDEAMRMGENGKNAISNQYNWESASKSLLQLYTNIINGR